MERLTDMKEYTIIREDRLVKATCANIDEKNVSTDWIEEVFDNGKCVMTDCRAVGFVKDYPVSAHWRTSDNTIFWSCDSKAVLFEVGKRLQALEDKDSALFSNFGIVGDTVVQTFYFQTDK